MSGCATPALKVLSLFMYREPKAAKRLYFDVIPRHVDEYYQFLGGFERQDPRQQLSNPVWHIHSGKPPKIDMPISFAHAAYSRILFECRECRNLVGLHWALPAWRHGEDAPQAE